MKQREKPTTYGTWWNTNNLDESWYAQIFSTRWRAHEVFLDWFCQRIADGEQIESVLEVGCGRGEPYANFFSKYKYSGTDISTKEIEYCKQTYPSSNFFVSDAIQNNLGGPYDLVFAHAVIDHVYDLNAFIEKLVAASKGWVYITSYRDWNPQLTSHQYEWEEALTCYNNRVSPTEAARTLKSAGCSYAAVYPCFVRNVTDSFPLETVLVGKISGVRRFVKSLRQARAPIADRQGPL